MKQASLFEGVIVHQRKIVSEARRLWSVRVGGFRLTEGIHSQGAELPWHDHETPTICFVLKGAFTEMWRGGSLLCTTSTLKVTPAGERHCDQFSRGNVRGLLIEADAPQVAAIRPYSAVLDQRLSFRDGIVSSIAWRVFEELHRTDTAAPIAIEGLLLELVATISRLQERNGTSEVPPWLREARDCIRDDLAARPSLAGLATTVGVHPVTLARGFRRAYGCTVGEYIRQLRVERASHQLADTDLPLAEIAFSAGFSDQSHFSNEFRRHTGFSPSRFRRVVRAS